MDYSTSIKQIRNRLTSELAVRQSKIEELSTTKQQKEDNLLLLEKTEKARAITQIVAEETQKKIEFHISNLVTMAISIVYPNNPYEFKLRFVLRRNKTEADLIFAKGENETDDILNAGGGGPADVAAFALRIAAWSLKKTRNIFILDEPFKCISLDKQEKCSEMIKEISDKLKVQIIIISHLEELVGFADKVIEVTNVDGVSTISK